MTVAELIKKLQEFDPELVVVFVGPREWGDLVFEIELVAGKDSLLWIEDKTEESK